MQRPAKAEIMREVKDYFYITRGLISYSSGWAAFLLPYQITTGGTTGIGAIIYYASGFHIHPYIRSAIQHKDNLCYFHADFLTLDFPNSSQ